MQTGPRWNCKTCKQFTFAERLQGTKTVAPMSRPTSSIAKHSEGPRCSVRVKTNNTNSGQQWDRRQNPSLESLGLWFLRTFTENSISLFIPQVLGPLATNFNYLFSTKDSLSRSAYSEPGEHLTSALLRKTRAQSGLVTEHCRSIVRVSLGPATARGGSPFDRENGANEFSSPGMDSESGTRERFLLTRRETGSR